MHRKTTKIVKLTTAKSLNEAVIILKDRKAPSIFKQSVETAFNLKNDKNNKIRIGMLNEAEQHLTAYEKDLSENIVTEQQTEGTNGKDGQTGEGTGQADGRELDALTETPESGDGSEPAQAQTGESQLDTALTKINETGPNEVDPMNKAIMDYMEDGMSQVEAGNAVVKDKKLSEAVFNTMFRKQIVPLLKAVGMDMNSLRETIMATDSKVEIARVPDQTNGTGGLNETVIIPETQASQGAKYSNDLDVIASKKSHITDKYMSS